MAISLGHANLSHILLLARSLPKVDAVIKEIAKLDSAIKTTFMAVELDNQT
jgi:hypothetical protein